MKGDGHHASGFTLVEMAIVLVIVGLLLGGLLMPLSSQIRHQRIRETSRTLEEIKEALIGYMASRGALTFLPCPDETVPGVNPANFPNDGVEDRNGAACEFPEGNLPWATLGTSPFDAWGNRFRYRVTPAFSNSVGFTLATLGDITVQTRINPASAVSPLANTVPAVILSHGPNGFGAINSANLANVAPTGLDELENTNSDTTFICRTETQVGTAFGEFDDLVAWVSPSILMSRKIAAGLVP